MTSVGCRTVHTVLAAACWLCLCGASQFAVAQSTGGSYPNGTSGLLAGTVPPPGHYWLMYNRLYTASQSMNADGAPQTVNGEPMGFDLDVFANVHRFIHVTEMKIFGADYAWNFVLPVIGVDLDVSAYQMHDQAWSFGDFNAEPFVIEWHEPRFDFGFVYGLFAPTGQRSPAHPALPGSGYFTQYAGLAGTLWLDAGRTWSASILSRYEVHNRRRDDGFRRGDDFSFEWGVGKTFLPPANSNQPAVPPSKDPIVTAGVSGYAAWQITRNTGPMIDYPAPYEEAFGIGPEVQSFFPQWNIGYHLRHWWEFDCRAHTQGRILTFTLVKPF